MTPAPGFAMGGRAGPLEVLEVLKEDAEFILYRTRRNGTDGDRRVVLTLLPAVEHPSAGLINRLAHEYDLKHLLDDSWAIRPIDLVREGERASLVLDFPGGVLLERHLQAPLELGLFLRLAIGIATAVGHMHARGLVHKDIKPANIFVDAASGRAWLTGFGIASRFRRERQSPDPPEFIAGTLAYMAPEQTGRMNRSVDSRSDLYCLGVTLYQMLSGSLPFTASDPMEWVHCHIARKPAPLSERTADIPAPVGVIIMKLLAKNAEDRYQTATGLVSDLRRCLVEWESRNRIDEFSLDEHGTADQILIPEKLYGRESEIETLLASFGRVAASGRSELVLVLGQPGIGKSTVVSELHKALVPAKGLFASGKFDQYKHDIPYATVAQALQSLVRSLLSKPERELRVWRDAFREALGPHGLLMADLVPELKHVIGEQPPLPVLLPHDAQRRFQQVLRQFIGVFARHEHPLILFIDDLQWLDAGTLDVLEDLLIQPEVPHLLLIGAYRDNEIDSAHPLTRKLDAIRKAGAAVQEIILAPLTNAELEQLVADTLRCDPARAAPLAGLLHEKTAGNPFFAIQFLASLAEEQLLMFDHREARWSWDLKRIRAKSYTDNVVELLVTKISRLREETRTALQELACLGSNADFALLAMAQEDPAVDIHGRLQEAIQPGLVLRTESTYVFLHDRVQEAAYSLIPKHSRAAIHRRIGRLLAARIPPQKREERIFEIVNQLNRGSQPIDTAGERTYFAELNLMAARRAKLSTAYASALGYLRIGRALVCDRSWDDSYETLFPIEYLMAECELLTADMAAAEQRLAVLALQAKSEHDTAIVTRLRLTLYTTLDRSDRAVQVCLEYLRRGGTSWSPHPARDEVQREYACIRSRLEGREIEELIDLPLMSNPDALDELHVLAEAVTPALFCDENLSSLVICRMVNVSLEHGNSDASCFAYVWLAIIAGPRFGDYRDGFRFGRLGHDLVEQRGLTRFKARTYMSFGDIVLPWTKHVRAGRDLIHRAFAAANEIGDVTFAGYCCDHLIKNMLAAGDPLPEVERAAENSLQFAQKVRFGLVVDHIKAQLGLIRTLRGVTATFGSFNDERFDEHQFEHYLGSNSALAELECWYWVRKLQARFLAGEYASAIAAAVNAQRRLWTSPSQFETAEIAFYGALALAASWNSAAPDGQQILAALAAFHGQLAVWEENCPENFADRQALVAAEIARIEHRDLDAERLYERAIRSAHANGFVHNEALGYEIAARFYAARGFDKFARIYLQEARSCYLRWGAKGKVSQLERLFPQLREETPATIHTGTIGAHVESLDLATVVKLSQAMSGPMALEELIDTLLRTAVENAGAARGVLVLARGDQYRVVAEATANADAFTVGVKDSSVGAADLPESVIQYVFRTRQMLLLHDASRDESFFADQYVARHHARSILCLPLLEQSRLLGVLYLENNLAADVFTAARLVVLRLLVQQAAISLQSVQLSAELRERDARLRRLVESNIIGIAIWGFDGRIVDTNEAFLHIVGFDREDFSSGRVGWPNLIPPERREFAERQLTELKERGTVQAFEFECVQKNGAHVPVLVGSATFEQGGEQGVSFVVDLTESKAAERAVRESERRYREVEMALAHASRVATLGQMSASIAHEINQPVAAAVTNAQAALRFLAADTPNVEEVRQALGRIARLGNRVVEVVGRIRALVKKTPPRHHEFEINDAIDEVLSLTHGELVKNGVCLSRELAARLPLVHADRVQLQQVVMNLITNAVEAMSILPKCERRLRISSSAIGADSILIAVADSGPGVAPANLNSVFDPFYTTKPEGLGIGLSICRSIIEAHEGRLWAEANSPRGATFVLTLPTTRNRAR